MNLDIQISKGRRFAELHHAKAIFQMPNPWDIGSALMLEKAGAQAAPGSPQDFSNFIADEVRKWGAIAKTAGLEPQ